MARQDIETTILIEAPTAVVWQALTDFAAFPAWNPFIRSISGPLEEGGRLAIQVQPPEGRAMGFRPKILKVASERELRWRGMVLIPGLFDGEHYFRLDPVGMGTTRFTHGERFSGLLVGPFARRGILEATRQGFEAMNRALKHRIEARSFSAA